MKTKSNPQTEVPVPAADASSKPPQIFPSDVVVFLGRDRYEKLVEQAAAYGFTGKTLLDAAIARTPKSAPKDLKPLIAGFHLVRLAGSAPSKRDRVRYQATEQGLSFHDILHPEHGLVDTVLVKPGENPERLREIEIETFKRMHLPLPAPKPAPAPEQPAN